MGTKRPRHCATGDRMHHRRFDFKKLTRDEEVAHIVNHRGPCTEGFAGFFIDDEVNVTLPITRLHVGEPVPFFG